MLGTTDLPGTSQTRTSSRDDSHSRGVSNRRDVTKADMPQTSQTRNSGREVAAAEVLATEGMSQKQTCHEHHKQETVAGM